MRPAQSFDIAFVGDFQLWQDAAAVACEMRALSDAGYSLALLPARSAVEARAPTMAPEITACITEGKAELIDGNGPVDASLAVLRNPLVFDKLQEIPPPVRASRKILVASEPPLDVHGLPRYDIGNVLAACEAILGPGLKWAPVSPICREACETLSVEFLDMDWPEVVLVEDWRVDRSTPVGEKPVIGRHCDSSSGRWPNTRALALKAYPGTGEVVVRLAGPTDEFLEAAAPLPGNWETQSSRAVDPKEFLETIDFFVYYHHPDWIETHGRPIAEAIASGAVAILPDYLSRTFSEAALYREPEDVHRTVIELHRDWEYCREHAVLAERAINERFGPARLLELVDQLMRDAPAVRAPAPRGRAPTASPTPAIEIVETDVAIAGDFRSVREPSWQVAQEVRIQAQAGYRTALIQIEADEPHRWNYINPEIDACVREGLAVPVDPQRSVVKAALLVVRQPHAILGAVEKRLGTVPKIAAHTVVVVADALSFEDDGLGGLTEAHHVFRGLFGDNLLWTATRPDLFERLRTVSPPLPVYDEPWQTAIHIAPTKPRSTMREVPVIGRSSLVDADQWPDSAEQVLAVYPADNRALVRLQGLPRLAALPLPEPPAEWEYFGVGDVNWRKYLSNLDFFVYYPSSEPLEVPETAILWSMAHGVPAIMPPELKTRFGEGPIYARAEDALETAERLFADRESYAALASETARKTSGASGPTIHRTRLRRLVPTQAAPPQPARRVSRPRRNRVMFVSSNGVGLGHLTRLLAIARRLETEVAPIFATMSQAIEVVEQCGFPVEYIPSQQYAQCDGADWNSWLRAHLEQLLRYYDASHIVFDGVHAYGGLIKAAALHLDRGLVWVRRGMWRKGQPHAPFITRQKFFDLVIEPEDLAASRDLGATPEHREKALVVPPIRLLDPEELLSREEAANALGLDPDHPNVLVQLGSGANRDIFTLIERVLSAAQRFPELQVVLAEWLMSSATLDFWPGVKRLQGFPISRYYAAFDFTISAVGYNSFNEAISFGLPAIFSANTHAAMDDQLARASFAEEQGAAFHLKDGGPEDLGSMIDAMMDEKVRRSLRDNTLRIARPNGATEAARAIMELLN